MNEYEIIPYVVVYYLLIIDLAAPPKLLHNNEPQTFISHCGPSPWPFLTAMAAFIFVTG